MPHVSFVKLYATFPRTWNLTLELIVLGITSYGKTDDRPDNMVNVHTLSFMKIFHNDMR